MATIAQLISNQQNAQLSTGPVTPEGKSISSKNRLTNGLFSNGDFIRPEEQTEYESLRATLQAELAAATTLEQTYATEILSATWRLRRCSLVEADPASAEDDYRSVDRVRINAHNILRRATTELRRHQTERQIRNAVYPEGADLSDLGLASTKETIAAQASCHRARLISERVGDLDEFASLLDKGAPGVPHSGSFRNAFHKLVTQPKPAASTAAPASPQTAPIARNALCPCNSGQKFKRCCGHNAPAILGKVA